MVNGIRNDRLANAISSVNPFPHYCADGRRQPVRDLKWSVRRSSIATGRNGAWPAKCAVHRGSSSWVDVQLGRYAVVPKIARAGSSVGDVMVRFDGSGVVSAEIACAALQPVLDSVYHRYCWESMPVVEEALRYVGRGAFSRDGIEKFASYICMGERPVLTSKGLSGDRMRLGRRSGLRWR